MLNTNVIYDELFRVLGLNIAYMVHGNQHFVDMSTGMALAEMITRTFVDAIVLVGVLRLKLAGVSGV